jgi:uncharacterized protein
MNSLDKPQPRTRPWKNRLAAAFRWLHIYLSLISFTALLFFAVTGITLNHPTWLGAGEQVIKEYSGSVATSHLGETVDQLQIAESLRSEHNLRGRVAQFEVNDSDCLVVFKSPGYSADCLVDRASGKYSITESSSGLVAVLNDLHKGRDSGAAWSLVIDISAIIMIAVSLSGLALLFYLRRKRNSGLVTLLIGTLMIIAAWILLVP